MTNSPVRFYFHPTPNPMKVALLLEELGAPYEIALVDVFKGEQHEPVYRQVNPNGKVPALVDDGVTLFDSNAILIHLAEKHGRFFPKSGQARASTLSWLQLVATGVGPFSGQAVHFNHYAPEKIPYAIHRYMREIERHYQVLDARLADAKWLAGDDYTIADMALWGWARGPAFVFGEQGLAQYPNVARLVDAINARPAAERASALKDKVTIKTTFDAEAKKAMFPFMQA
jgi:GSH-dependent disulfide-bond oxidoreductase